MKNFGTLIFAKFLYLTHLRIAISRYVNTYFKPFLDKRDLKNLGIMDTIFFFFFFFLSETKKIILIKEQIQKRKKRQKKEKKKPREG